jgi:hypothetical protein
MSMKRSKARSGGSSRRSGAEEDPWAKPPEPEPVWADVEAKPDEAFVPFALTSRYGKGALISHPKFGKGVVVAVDGARIEVLFQDGKKKLGHAVT